MLFIVITRTILEMNISLTDELESVIEEKVKSGFYNNASEVVRDALRRAFCEPQKLDLEKDTPELAALIREGRNSRYTPHRKGARVASKKPPGSAGHDRAEIHARLDRDCSPPK